ncbi:lipoate--protein ligase family protein [Thermococcus barophilus]|uniref:Biotin/lipoate A/B protein ligase family protein n=1 Tax=Thermococcus barophilus TaxID=55802 RepID=A0A0S1XFA2_THEBA|nr:biotin/lipoate A/B protein ligase family protein [Thermococcus barophilus]ALM76455.1 Biotin/lipoate A/B protein ligase family protein [Thermococcus barophilus]
MLRILTYEIPNNPYLNLAFEEALARARSKDLVEDTLRLWRNEKALILGYFRNPKEDINLLVAKERKIPIIRRFSGGGTVYHDTGCVNYSLTIKRNVKFPISYLYNELLKGTLLALKKLGINAYVKNTNDIIVNERKVSGTAASIKWGVLFLHGSILVNSDLKMLYLLLKIPKNIKPSIDPVKYQVANLSSFLGNVSVDEVMNALISSYSKILMSDYYFDEPRKEELNIANILLKEKYLKDEWNFKVPPKIDEKEIEKKINAILER